MDVEDAFAVAKEDLNRYGCNADEEAGINVKDRPSLIDRSLFSDDDGMAEYHGMQNRITIYREPVELNGRKRYNKELTALVENNRDHLDRLREVNRTNDFHTDLPEEPEEIDDDVEAYIQRELEEAFGHELIHHGFTSRYRPGVEGWLKEHAKQYPVAREEAAAQFYSTLKHGTIEDESKRQEKLKRIRASYDNGDAVAEHLENTFKVYDSFNLPREEAARETFNYLDYAVKQEMKEYDLTPSLGRLMNIDKTNAGMAGATAASSGWLATEGEEFGAGLLAATTAVLLVQGYLLGLQDEKPAKDD